MIKKDQLLKVDQVTAYFLELSASSGDNDLTQLKLHKLLYYAQGICLAISGEPLFDSELHAWPLGPVCTTVYYDLPAGSSLLSLYENNDELVKQLAQKEKSLVYFIDRVYGRYSAHKLSAMTHQESPWKNANKTYREEIPHIAIRKFFEVEIKNRDKFALQHSCDEKEMEDIIDSLACIDHDYNDTPAISYSDFKKIVGW